MSGTSTPIGQRDIAASVVLGLASGALYVWMALQLSRSDYGLADNFAFDLDAKLYMCTYALSPMSMGGVKHPLLLLLRPIVQAVMLLGATPEAAAGLVMAAAATLSVALFHLFARVIGVAAAIAVPFTALYALCATQLFFSMIPETYGPAACGLAALWLMAALRLERPAAGGKWRYLVAGVAFGVTITNVVQAFLVELAVWLRAGPMVAALRRTTVFGLWLAVPLGVLLLGIWHDDVLAMLRDPIGWLKHVYWMQTFSEKAGVGQILLTFLEFVVVAPAYVWVPLEEGWNMRDFRVPDFSPVGMVAVAGWSVLLLGGIITGLRDHAMRWLTVSLLIAFAFNVLLHTRFQFRLSLFIYTPHVMMIIFGLAAGLARAASRGAGTMRAMAVAMAALAVVVAVNNVPKALAFSQDFRNTGIKVPFTCEDYASGRNLGIQ